MSGVYIKGMDMPKDCWHCRLADPIEGGCLVDQKMHGDWDEPDNCPLVPVPPHGRLIDADEVNHHICGWVDLRGCPTIIPAEEEAPAGPYDLLYEEGGPNTT